MMLPVCVAREPSRRTIPRLHRLLRTVGEALANRMLIDQGV